MPRRTLILALIPLLAGLLPSCQTMTPEAWASALRPEYSSPEETGRSFFAAWAAKKGDKEYTCLSEDFKAKVGATLDAYLLFRPELEKQIGWVGRHAFRLEPQSKETLANGNVLVWWGRGSTTYLGLEMQRQQYFDFHEAGDKDHRAGASLDLPLAEYFEFSGREFSLYLENSSVRTARNMEEISKFEIGSEWKIAGLIQPTINEDGAE
jgi:hypothetical protein